jgi:hypothetical protein
MMTQNAFQAYSNELSSRPISNTLKQSPKMKVENIKPAMSII